MTELSFFGKRPCRNRRNSPQGLSRERYDDGISLSRFEGISGEARPIGTINELIDDGLIIRQGDRLKTTPQGHLLLNAVTEKILVC